MNYVTHNKFAVPINHNIVVHAWRARGFSCDTFVDPPGREWNDFVHATNELVTVIDGQLSLTIAGEELIIEPGDEVFVPKGAYHSVKNIHHAATRWLYGYDS